jgi:hypothetical protein
MIKQYIPAVVFEVLMTHTWFDFFKDIDFQLSLNRIANTANSASPIAKFNFRTAFSRYNFTV